MNNKLLLVVVLIVVAFGGVLLFNKSNTVNTNSKDTTNQNPTPTKADSVKIESANVEVTSSGFAPQSLTVKTGTTVVWTNKSGGPVTVNSDSHPTHLKWPFLNLGKFDDSASVSVVFEKVGTYTYHNHLDASQVGTVIVE